MLSINLQQIIKAHIPDSEVIIKSDDGVHFEATIISDSFNGQKSLVRQRMVYAAVKEQISSGEVHALSLKTFTNEEWKQK